MNRRWLAVPCAALLLVLGVPGATAEPGPVRGLVEPPADVVEVGQAADGMTVIGLEVSRRAITWGSAEIGPASSLSRIEIGPADPLSRIDSRAYTPDLGKKPLALGAALAPVFPQALNAVSTDRWAIGFAPLAGDIDGYPLWVKDLSNGAVRDLRVPAEFDFGDGTLALWGNTVLVGPMLVNLIDESVFVAADVDPCLDSSGATLADGVLLVRDTCEGTVEAVDVSAAGIVAGDFATARTVIEGEPILMAYSRGLVVWSGEVGPEVTGVRWQRIDEPVGSYSEIPIPLETYAIRVQGERFLLVVDFDGGLVAVACEAATCEDGPVGVWEMATGGSIGLSFAELEGLAASRDPSSDMNLYFLAIDLYGRTAAWSAGGETIMATTLPVLPGDVSTISAPTTGKAGEKVTVTGGGFLPGEEIALWLTSTPVMIGQGFATADGTIAMGATLPAATTGGNHTLTLVGVESGWSVESGIAITAAGQNPGLRVDTGR